MHEPATVEQTAPACGRVQLTRSSCATLSEASFCSYMRRRFCSFSKFDEFGTARRFGSSFGQAVDRPDVDPWTLSPLQSGGEYIARERYGEPQADHSDGRSHRPCEQASATFFMPSAALSIVEIVQAGSVILSTTCLMPRGVDVEYEQRGNHPRE